MYEGARARLLTPLRVNGILYMDGTIVTIGAIKQITFSIILDTDDGLELVELNRAYWEKQIEIVKMVPIDKDSRWKEFGE